MKTYFKCKRTLELEQFYRHPETADGRLGKCKECTRRDNAQHYETHRLQVYQTAKLRRQRPDFQAIRAKHGKRTKLNNPIKIRARQKLQREVKNGRVIRPSQCSKCGKVCKPEGHHTDYSRPLDVVWLCFKCHQESGHGHVVVSDFERT